MRKNVGKNIAPALSRAFAMAPACGGRRRLLVCLFAALPTILASAGREANAVTAEIYEPLENREFNIDQEVYIRGRCKQGTFETRRPSWINIKGVTDDFEQNTPSWDDTETLNYFDKSWPLDSESGGRRTQPGKSYRITLECKAELQWNHDRAARLISIRPLEGNYVGKLNADGSVTLTGQVRNGANRIEVYKKTNGEETFFFKTGNLTSAFDVTSPPLEPGSHELVVYAYYESHWVKIDGVIDGRPNGGGAIVVHALPAAAIEKTVSADTAEPGQLIKYTIHVRNQTAGALRHLLIRDRAPDHTQLVASSCGELTSDACKSFAMDDSGLADTQLTHERICAAGAAPPEAGGRQVIWCLDGAIAPWREYAVDYTVRVDGAVAAQ
jgi:uncharacterized repeat protein (TIGR01451 family)